MTRPAPSVTSAHAVRTTVSFASVVSEQPPPGLSSTTAGTNAGEPAKPAGAAQSLSTRTQYRPGPRGTPADGTPSRRVLALAMNALKLLASRR